jgi:hypothetical protein
VLSRFWSDQCQATIFDSHITRSDNISQFRRLESTAEKTKTIGGASTVRIDSNGQSRWPNARKHEGIRQRNEKKRHLIRDVILEFFYQTAQDRQHETRSQTLRLTYWCTTRNRRRRSHSRICRRSCPACSSRWRPRDTHERSLLLVAYAASCRSCTHPCLTVANVNISGQKRDVTCAAKAVASKSGSACARVRAG